MIAWLLFAALLAPAHAQNVIDTALEKSCDDPRPVAGTAGFTNGLTSIRTNAQTYGAGEFARRRLRGDTYMAIDYHGVLGVARVPTFCDTDTGGRAQTIYNQPMDVGATNLGLNAPFVQDKTDLHVSFKAFYAASVTQSSMGSRWATLSTAIMNLYPVTFAPLVGRSSSGRSLTTFAVDYIAGATFRSDVISVQAGYTGTRGLYLDVTQDKIGVFVNTAFTDGQFTFDKAAYLLGGVQDFDLLDLGLNKDTFAKFGTTSAFYRRIPQTEAPPDSAGPLAEARAGLEQLKTGHFRQQDIAQRIDFRSAWQFGQSSRLRELAAAVHTDNWHQREKLKRAHNWDGESAYLKVGMVNLPDQPLFGVNGGPRPTVKGVLRGRTPSGAAIEGSVLMNDPDLLDLYPFAYNSLGFNIEVSIDGGAW